MGVWVYIRGWVEFYGQREKAERIIRQGETQGWTFPAGGLAGRRLQVRDGELIVSQAPPRYDYLGQ
ncbi:hypothetical protein OHA25_02130 [Nonomuraea sp. NBC_00507]|uniref:hypothetical protein n=1 Tax=Nonomuraea sp. NBC_00507 TaxID=2976002 RepID=UPI002E19BB42